MNREYSSVAEHSTADREVTSSTLVAPLQLFSSVLHIPWRHRIAGTAYLWYQVNDKEQSAPGSLWRGTTGNFEWPRGLMDKASDFESEDCGFDPHRGLRVYFFFNCNSIRHLRLTFHGTRTNNLRLSSVFTYSHTLFYPNPVSTWSLPAATDYSLRGPMDKASPSYFVKRRKARIAGSSPAGGSIGFWFCLNFPTQNIYKIAFSIETCCNTLKLSGSIYSSGRPVINMAHEC